MYYVYIIKSVNTPHKLYVGSTCDVYARLTRHNDGGSVYTRNYKPWELVWYCSFKEKLKALSFEKYLKTYSGRSFLQKHFLG